MRIDISLSDDRIELALDVQTVDGWRIDAVKVAERFHELYGDIADLVTPAEGNADDTDEPGATHSHGE